MRVVSWASKHALLLAGCSLFALCQSSAIVEAAQPFLIPGSLVVSTSTYDNTQGAVASLTPGVTTLAGTSTFGSPPTCSTASAGGDYVNVWNNDSVDGSFGVTSQITLTDINPATGQILATLPVPASQVVTSFSSKSELALSFTVGPKGPLLTFEDYGGPGVGAIDVSNGDAVAGQDPSNPVTPCFGSGRAFPRTIASVSKTGAFTFTPTIAYGGDNPRGVIYSPDAGLYYSVGNSNNGLADDYTYACPGKKSATNCTDPNVTETTGLEAVNPLNWPSWNYGTIPTNNSEQADPMYASVSGDKPGKDSNFRGVTEFNGALYFTKGSGSNGINTLYTVSPNLPTVKGAPSATVSIVPGFPTDVAKTSGGNFTPFGIFFANATTVYVADEGSGNTLDATSHAGLEKWSLVGGTWQLDYVLQNGLLNTPPYTLTGYDGPYPTVTTVGLRELTGVVNGNSVTLWAETSTNSSSMDAGADPNEVVTITDSLPATQQSQVTGESFSVLGAPTYGTVYRGVAYIAN